MTNFERLLPYLLQAARGGGLSDEAVQDVRAFSREQAYLMLPRTLQSALATGDHALYLLRLTADVLVCLANEDFPAAFEAAQQARGLPLRPDPFGGRVYLLAARVAEKVAAWEAQRYFQQRYSQYLEQFADSHALSGLSELLTNPSMTQVLEEQMLSEQEAPEVFFPPYLPNIAVSSGLSSFSTSEETSTRTYFVLVRKLTNARAAAFAIFNATLADITDGGDYGRADQHGNLFADLVLVFERDASELLASLNPENLAVRFVFHHSEAFETFSISDGGLFDLEVSVEERRFYFKLRIPPAWIAAQVPLHAVWTNLESCVLISEDE